MDVHVRGLPRSGTSLVNTLLTRNLPTDQFNVTAGRRHDPILTTHPDGWVVHVIKDPLAFVDSYRTQAELPYSADTPDEDEHPTVKTDENIDHALASWWLDHNQNLDRYADHRVRHTDILTPDQQAGWVNRVRELLSLDSLDDPFTPDCHVNDTRDRWDSREQMVAYYQEGAYRANVDEARITSCFATDDARELLTKWGWGHLA